MKDFSLPSLCVCQVCGDLANMCSIDIPRHASLDNNSYTYLQCGSCSSLTLHNESLIGSVVYSESYPSFSKSSSSLIWVYLRRLRNLACFWSEGGIFGKLLSFLKPLPIDFTVISKFSKKNSHVIDIGCGGGKYIDELVLAGYKNLIGIDPFLAKDDESTLGINLFKLNINQVSGKFDVLVSHHSFEHVVNPSDFLKSAARLMHQDSFIIITVPIIGEVFSLFHKYTSTITPPQHTYMYTVKGMRRLLELSNFQLCCCLHEVDSNLQWLENSYKLVLKDPNVPKDFYKSFPSPDKFKQLVQNWRQRGVGDNVVFVASLAKRSS
jgi:SAM-dependent methyltransferase